jgi:hypothetical protein
MTFTDARAAWLWPFFPSWKNSASGNSTKNCGMSLVRHAPAKNFVYTGYGRLPAVGVKAAAHL